MKTTIYELLGMIKDGNAPKKILFEKKIYEYVGDDYLYKDEDRHEYWLFSESYAGKFKWLDEFLNDEVEILDEPKENIKTIDNYICAVGPADNMELEVGDLIYIKELGYWYEVEANGISKGIGWYDYYPEIFELNKIFELNNWHITKIVRKGQITELGDKENE